MLKEEDLAKIDEICLRHNLHVINFKQITYDTYTIELELVK